MASITTTGNRSSIKINGTSFKDLPWYKRAYYKTKFWFMLKWSIIKGKYQAWKERRRNK